MWSNRLRASGRRSSAGVERGQTLLVVALMVVPVSFVMGLVVVDAGVWTSERRGAQKDADLAALAGAYELLVDDQDESAARQAAYDYAMENSEAGNTAPLDKDATDKSAANSIVVDDTCFDSDTLDSVVVNLNHESRLFFADAVGVQITPDIGAHARACMGSPIEGEGIFPLGVQVTGFDTECFEPDPDDPTGPELPIFGQFCRLAFAGDELSSGEGGFLRLYNDGGDTCSNNNTGGGQQLGEEIEQGGAFTTCYVAPPGTTSDDCDGPPPSTWVTSYVNYCVWPKTQTFNNPTQDSFTDLIATEGECDDEFGNGDGIDDWLEVVEPVNGDPNPDPGSTTFARRDCDSPRLVNLVIIEQFDVNGNSPRPILAFASFYIEACEVDGEQFRDCDVQGGQIGQASLYGFFMNILNIGTIGAANEYGQRTIALVE